MGAEHGQHAEDQPRISAAGARQLSLLKRIAFSAAAIFGGLLFLAAIGELAVRFARGKVWSLASPRAERIALIRSINPFVYDPLLGWVPRATDTSTKNLADIKLTINADGTRSNGLSRPADGDPIVVVGDSFAFGANVSDDETWPAYLERDLGCPVINGGVPGYGFDQIVLRAEKLLQDKPSARCLIVSLIPDDILRCDYAYSLAWKPYFGLGADGLEIKNVPVPRAKLTDRTSCLWRVLGYSHLADAALTLFLPATYITEEAIGRTEETRNRRRPDSEKVPCYRLARAILDRLLLGIDRNVPVLLVIQPEHPRPIGTEPLVMKLITHARKRRIRVLDLIPVVHEAVQHRPDEIAGWFFPDRHMTPAGNRWVAEQVATAIQGR